MTEQQLKEFLEENKADIAEAVKRATIERMIAQHNWDISSQIREVVSKFVADNVVPEVQAHLESQKGVFVAAIINSLSEVSDELAKSLAADALKNIATEYKRREIVKAIFTGY